MFLGHHWLQVTGTLWSESTEKKGGSFTCDSKQPGVPWTTAAVARIFLQSGLDYRTSKSHDFRILSLGNFSQLKEISGYYLYQFGNSTNRTFAHVQDILSLFLAPIGTAPLQFHLLIVGASLKLFGGLLSIMFSNKYKKKRWAQERISWLASKNETE